MTTPHEEVKYKDPCKSCHDGVCEQCDYGYCSEEDKKKRWLENHNKEAEEISKKAGDTKENE